MTHSEIVKKTWKDSISKLETIGSYSFKETERILLADNLFEKYNGKAKNRTLLKDNPKLYNSIYQHSQRLEEVFKNQRSYKSNYNLTHRIKFIVELNGDLGSLKCTCGRKFNWTKYCRFCPEPKKNQLGIPHTEETKRKMRLSTLSYLSELKGQLAPRYNKDSIKLIEQYGVENGYKFMHAENGGEYYVNELGYFLDAYDPIFNVALEIDEEYHFDKDGFLRQRDLSRQKEIEEKLGCKFIRLRYGRI